MRNFGLAEPPVKGLVQGAYSHAWVDMNLARQVGMRVCTDVQNWVILTYYT